MTHVATDASFARDVLEADVPVLVEFTAPWCRPCRAIEPILDELPPSTRAVSGSCGWTSTPTCGRPRGTASSRFRQ